MSNRSLSPFNHNILGNIHVSSNCRFDFLISRVQFHRVESRCIPTVVQGPSHIVVLKVKSLSLWNNQPREILYKCIDMRFKLLSSFGCIEIVAVWMNNVSLIVFRINKIVLLLVKEVPLPGLVSE